MGEIQHSTVDGPATHALLIGVSDYPHGVSGPQETTEGNEAGIGPVDGVASTVAEILEWLLGEYRNPDAPLATVQVLLSPTAGEVLPPSVSARPEIERATLANAKAAVAAFRGRSRERRDNVAFAYIAGHGVQLTKDGAIVLLEDFANSSSTFRLEHAIDVARTREGFDGADDANHQFWFVDACRGAPLDAVQFETLEAPAAIDGPLGSVDTSIFFLGARPSGSSLLDEGVGTVFGRTVLEGLRTRWRGPEADFCAEWHVSANSLSKHVRVNAPRRAAALGETEPYDVEVSGKGDAPIQWREKPPEVCVALTLDPEEAAPKARAQLLQKGEAVLPFGGSWPVSGPVPAGVYILNVEADEPYVAGRDEALGFLEDRVYPVTVTQP